jgi:hypothetical protein
MAYEEYSRWIILGFPNVQQGPILYLLAGSIAGGTAVICTYPLDLVRTKLSYQVSPNPLTFFIEEEHCIVLVQSGFKSSSYELKYAKQHIHRRMILLSRCCLFQRIFLVFVLLYEYVAHLLRLSISYLSVIFSSGKMCCW